MIPIFGKTILTSHFTRCFRVPSQTISDTKTFTEKVSLNQLKTTTMHGKTINEIFENAAMTNLDENIYGHITFQNDVDIQNVFNVHKDMNVNGKINGVDIIELDGSVLKTTGTQTMTDKSVEGGIYVDQLTVTEGINGLDIATDLMTKETWQLVYGITDY